MSTNEADIAAINALYEKWTLGLKNNDFELFISVWADNTETFDDVIRPDFGIRRGNRHPLHVRSQVTVRPEDRCRGAHPSSVLLILRQFIEILESTVNERTLAAKLSSHLRPGRGIDCQTFVPRRYSAPHAKRGREFSRLCDPSQRDALHAEISSHQRQAIIHRRVDFRAPGTDEPRRDLLHQAVEA